MPACPGHLPVGGVASMVPELDVLDLEASLIFWRGILGFAVAHGRANRVLRRATLASRDSNIRTRHLTSSAAIGCVASATRAPI
jgi:catechol 2,3-dioxygenase-like lactoylglutathione lyase family enzyme